MHPTVPAGKRPRGLGASGEPSVDPNSQISKHEIKMGSLISDEGNFGTVWRGECRGSEVAIKKPRVSMNPQQIADFQREIRVLSSIYHPNICLFLGAYISHDEVLILTELMEGNVEQLLRDTSLSMLTKLHMMEDVARGVAWLHAQGLIHRDLKPSNCLYQRGAGDSLRVKVCDFGLSDLRAGNYGFLQEARPKGTPLYMSPEVLRSQPYDEKSDIYSFAIAMWEILAQREPYASVESVDALVHHVCVEEARPPLPHEWSESLRELLSQCWRPEAARRPSMEDILERMGSIIIETAVPDYAGQLFWKSLDAREGVVSFDTFSQCFFNQFPSLRGRHPHGGEAAPVLSGYVGEPAAPSSAPAAAAAAAAAPEAEQDRLLHPICVYLVRLLKVLFVQSEDQVSLEYFGRVLAWVGPIESDPVLFFFRVVHLYQQPWFFGALRTSDAASLLLTQPPGTFLVRFCNSPQLMGYYVLSVVTMKGPNAVVAHIRIKQRRVGTTPSFSLEKIPGPEHSSLLSLMQSCCDKLGLKQPCIGRKYELATWSSQVAEEIAALRTLYNERLESVTKGLKKL